MSPLELVLARALAAEAERVTPRPGALVRIRGRLAARMRRGPRHLDRGPHSPTHSREDLS